MLNRRLSSIVRWLGVLGALTTLVLVCPAPSRAFSSRAVDPLPWVPVGEQGMTGGILRLRSPGRHMIRVSPSEFWMGSTEQEVWNARAECVLATGVLPDNEEDDDECSEQNLRAEMPRHRVRLSAYWLDQTEVTVADYARCVAVGRCLPVPFAQGGRRFDAPTLPVSLVTFADAERYCHWRGARLPTEAEFERAARGKVGRTYPWGNAFNARAANHGRLGWDRTEQRDGFRELAPVGSLPAGRTPEGFFDLAGNVSEWSNDRFGAYSPKLAVDPAGPAGSWTAQGQAGGLRVTRGGDYQSPPVLLRGATRRSADPGARRPFVGFRCARGDRPPPSAPVE